MGQEVIVFIFATSRNFQPSGDLPIILSTSYWSDKYRILENKDVIHSQRFIQSHRRQHKPIANLPLSGTFKKIPRTLITPLIVKYVYMLFMTLHEQTNTRSITLILYSCYRLSSQMVDSMNSTRFRRYLTCDSSWYPTTFNPGELFLRSYHMDGSRGLRQSSQLTLLQ